ncbi:hypothetical protein F5X96DRAFT_518268 [Biscogniauxia mediterranea]|nr:hypothetical protein F5X96DRAFT_518268 [Biscogniauxia mediterranea]
MPSQNLQEVLAAKPVNFTIKTGNGKWKCQIHTNRAAYERTQSATPAVPGITRSDSGLSTSSVSSAGSTSSKSSH